jgi:multidrug efflux pump subunit AcrA (membrane-fusion protein)
MLFVASGSVVVAALVPLGQLFAQAASGAASDSAGKPAIIERSALVIRPAESFRAPLHLEAVKSIELSARRDGVVSSVLSKLGDKVQAQAEIVRMDTREQQLELQRAQAALRAAEAEQSGAAGGDAGAAARVDIAKTDLELAQLRLEQCNVRTPIAGVVVRVHVVDGEFVNAGQPLVTIIDPTQLRVELPIDGSSVAAGASIPIKVEDQSVNATLEAVVPLNERFEPLRDLFLSVASGIALVDNSAGKFRAGQTVYSPMIPREPVVEIPTAALANSSDGERKVQVIREGFVRDIRVQPLGQVGEDRVFVSGRFAPTDELVLKSSEALLDGARVVPQDRGAAATSPAAPATGKRGSNF